jgi:ankyrin repeat protein
MLIDKEADVMATNNSGCNPLHAASANGHVDVIKLLIGVSSMDASKTDHLGRTALFFALRYGQHHAVQVLLSTAKIKADIRDWLGLTSLFAAVANGHFEVVELLVAASTPFEKECRVGRNLLWWARRAGNVRINQLLTQHQEPTDSFAHDDIFPADTVPFDNGSAWCDACTLSILHRPSHSCKACHGFLLCVDCFDVGIRCRDPSHSLLLG